MFVFFGNYVVFDGENMEISEKTLTSVFMVPVFEEFYALKVEAEISSEGSGFFFSGRHDFISQNSWMFASLTCRILCLVLYGCEMPIPVAVRSEAPVCGCSLSWIPGSNPGGGMDVCLL